MSAPVYRELPLTSIIEPEAAIRSAMDPVKLDDLAASIRDVGQIHPLSVYPEGERYRISAGHRRFCALDRLGDRLARCLVYESDAEAMLAVQIAENAMHEDMSPADEAIWFARLLDGLGIDTTGLSERLHFTRDYIEHRLALLAGDEQVFEAVAHRDLKLGVAAALNRCKDTNQRRMLLDMALHREATIRTVEGWVAEMNAAGVLQQRAVDEAAGTVAPTPLVAEPYRMRCDICDDDDDPHTMEMFWAHRKCKKMRDRLLQAQLAERVAVHE
jgi:ParB family chromosome partitioning protein